MPLSNGIIPQFDDKSQWEHDQKLNLKDRYRRSHRSDLQDSDPSG
jgi:hypothetical protein